MRWYFFLFVFVMFACGHRDKQLFQLLDSADHGITFSNNISEDDTLNILKLEYIYNGGGVAIGDFNNDGLDDIYFTGNMVRDRLYLNKGNLTFEDISDNAGIVANNKWRSGVAVADVNGDNLLDIYVCATIKVDSSLRANILYINQGINDQGYPTFVDEASRYGVADTGHSSDAAFFDYDNDGDLDLYVLTNTITRGVPTTYRPKVNDGTAENTDRLYRNNGNGTFTNVSKEAGIVCEGYGLGLAIADINQDGWQDIYVSNDYIANDLLYINNKNGTFTNLIDKYIKHQSQFSMGNDVTDFNNDGALDIITLDMLPEGSLRRKTVIGGSSYTTYINNEKFGYTPQHVRNMVQLNNGNGTFSEIGQLLGLYQTEWSWSPLFADFDNDGYKDVVITNGFPKDISDRDFSNFRNGPAGAVATPMLLLDSVPVVKVSDYAFKNNGDLSFTDVTQLWGLNKPSFSNGAAFSDLDNDGDLDYVVNNINEKAFLYENTLYSHGKSEKIEPHFLRIKLKGSRYNINGLGTKVSLYYDSAKLQYHDHSTYRGYVSTVENTIHFGLGSVSIVDSILIRWPDGNAQLLRNVKADRVLVVDHNESRPFRSPKKPQSNFLLKEISGKVNISFKHSESDFIDFNFQRTIPHKFSQSGPGLAVGDVNGDGLEDFLLGAPRKEDGTLFLQQKDATFSSKLFFKSATKEEEDEGLLLFDADNDNDLDVYAVSGGFEFEPENPLYQDRLYINDGKGNFKLDVDAIPLSSASGSCVRAADMDADGDLDLFVGGRVVPGKYPFPAESFILRNDKGKFTNVTDQIAIDLKSAGMISDGLWTDYNMDGRIDLMVVGEFMPITIFQNDGSKFIKVGNTGLDNFRGWWNSIVGSDFDKDGDIDFVVGNLGLNNFYKASNEHPLKVYAKDFDGNNSVDAVLSCYFKSEDGTMKEYPVHFWEELNSQSPKFRRRFSYYRDFGRTTMDQLLSTEDLKDALILTVNHTASSYIENLGNGKFTVKVLPILTQVAPVNGMVVEDFNDDGNPDVLMTGNDYGNEVFSGRYDAFTGLVLLGNGKGSFEVLPSSKSGFCVNGDGKALSRLFNVKNEELFIASQNGDSLKVYISNLVDHESILDVKPMDNWAELIYADGKKQRVEFYYGSGYLSQSTRKFRIPKGVTEIFVYDSKGKSRRVSPEI